MTFSRRSLLEGAGAALAGASLASAATNRRQQDPDQEPVPSSEGVLPIKLALKYHMVQVEASMVEKFKLLKQLGYDGVELDSPNDLHPEEVRAASQVAGLPVHGAVDSIHWRMRLSSADPDVRVEAIEGLRTALRDVHSYGGSSVLLVPGRVTDQETENHDQVWTRSIEGIRAVLPEAAEYGVRILIENVWNGFCYKHDGPEGQSAEQFARYIDELGSPWVGMYFDLGNHRKYGNVEEWVRTLGSRIVKLDVKDWSKEKGWAKIGDGDVDWPAVRQALREIRFTGWATAEVGGGSEERLAEILQRMRTNVLGA